MMLNKQYNTIVIIIIATLFFIISLSGISAANITIDENTSGGVLGAVNNNSVNPGDTIFLQPGTYNKTNQDTNITINKNITIQGNGPTNKVIIDARKLSRIFTIGNNTITTFINITFINASVTGTGGAIWNNYAYTTMTFINCAFINNSATANGGAISNLGNYTNISNCIFTNNNANSGGAINNGGHYCTVANSNFTANNASAGGGIYNTRNNFTIVNSTFTSNNANAGGALLNYQGQYTIIDNSNFIDNTAIDYGGAIANIAQPGDFIVNNSTFINNTVKDGSISVNTGGGAIFNNRLNFTVINSTFVGNTANTNGGAINNHANNSNINNSTFINNVASYGGGISNKGSMKVTGNIMTGNNATIMGNVIFNNGTMGILNLTFINNSTWMVKNGSTITLFANLTDDMGNPVTGQNISFYVNGAFLEKLTAIEGYSDILYFINQGSGILPVSGSYDGNGNFPINILEGKLLIVSETTVNGTINLDKDKYKVNETVKGNISVINNGSDTAYDVVVKINLPPEFILNGVSVVVSHGYFDPSTNLWHIGNLTVGEEATMKFTGIFTKPGTYILDIVTSGNNFNTTKYSTTALVEEQKKPEEPDEPEENENMKVVQAAVMKETGTPLIIVMIILLSSLGLIIRKK